MEHHSPTGVSDWRASSSPCSRTYHLRGGAGGVVHVTACGGAGGVAGDDASAHDHPPPAYVAPRQEGAPARQSRSYAQATAASNRNEIWIPYSPSTICSYSPYPHDTHASLGHRCLAGLARWRLRRSKHIGGMATDHDATARVARSTPASLTVIKDKPNAVGGARRSSASTLEPSNPGGIAGSRQLRQRQRPGGSQRLSFSLRQITAPAQA